MILPSLGAANICSEMIWVFVLGNFFFSFWGGDVPLKLSMEEPETFSQEQTLLNCSALDKQLGHWWPDPRSAGQPCMHRHTKILLTKTCLL